MKQKTRIASKLFAALVVLTLISCCFVGTTFARYTSTGSGVASVVVAKWDINVGGGSMSDSMNFTFDKLSPTHTTSNSGTNVISGQSITITNTGDVDALLTISVDPMEYTGSLVTGLTATDLNNVFSFTLSYTGGSITVSGTKQTATISLPAQSGSITLNASVTWTTTSDTIDTLIGENITSVSWDVDFTAVQSSTLPDNQGN